MGKGTEEATSWLGGAWGVPASSCLSPAPLQPPQLCGVIHRAQISGRRGRPPASSPSSTPHTTLPSIASKRPRVRGALG